MNRCVIIGGADIRCYDRIKAALREDDFCIYCDSGLKHMEALGKAPGLIVGDFDSHENPYMAVETIVLPCEKDDTDTVFAMKEAIRRGYEEFLLIGMIGGRLDHTLGNVYMLVYLDNQCKKACMMDDHSEMELVSGAPAYIEDRYAFFSLLAVCGNARGVTIENAKYLLDHADISCEYQYGVSNEVLPGKTARVTVEDGKLLLIKDF